MTLTTALAAGSTVLASSSAEPASIGTVRAVAVTFLLALGTFFLIVGTVGLLRLPDVYNRLHATSKATTLGAASIFLAGFVYFGPGGAGLTSLVGIMFLFITAPTGGHVISRAAKRMGVEFWGKADWPEEAETWEDLHSDEPDPDGPGK